MKINASRMFAVALLARQLSQQPAHPRRARHHDDADEMLWYDVRNSFLLGAGVQACTAWCGAHDECSGYVGWLTVGMVAGLACGFAVDVRNYPWKLLYLLVGRAAYDICATHVLFE